MLGSFFHTSPGLKTRIMLGLPLYYGTLDTFLYARKEIFPLLCLFCCEDTTRSGIIITLGAKCGTPLSFASPGRLLGVASFFFFVVEVLCSS